VTSKKSVLAKHLYYDRSITTEFDLRTESGRRLFLAERCFLIVEFAATRPAARAIEIARERSGLFRYVGNVVIR
jgi:hypothetical protein